MNWGELKYLTTAILVAATAACIQHQLKSMITSVSPKFSKLSPVSLADSHPPPPWDTLPWLPRHLVLLLFSFCGGLLQAIPHWGSIRQRPSYTHFSFYSLLSQSNPIHVRVLIYVSLPMTPKFISYRATSKLTCPSDCSSFPPLAPNPGIFQHSSPQWKACHPSACTTQKARSYPEVVLDTFPILSPISKLPPGSTGFSSLTSLSYLHLLPLPAAITPAKLPPLLAWNTLIRAY